MFSMMDSRELLLLEGTSPADSSSMYMTLKILMQIA